MWSEIDVLRGFIKENMVHSDAIPAEQDLLSAGILDSFNVVEIALFIQQEFSIELEDEDISRNNFTSLAAMVELIQRRKA